MPSEAEKALYEKWINQWGFSKDAILEACFDTAKTTSPSFAYLDTILHGYYKKRAVYQKTILARPEVAIINIKKGLAKFFLSWA